MLEWLCSIFMTSTANLAFDAAIYSAGVASCNGVYQMKEPENLQKIAEEYKALAKIRK